MDAPRRPARSVPLLLQRAAKEGEVVRRERYSRVLASYAAAGRPEEAVATMKQMVSQGGVTPDIISFNCLIGAHASAGNPDRASGSSAPRSGISSPTS